MMSQIAATRPIELDPAVAQADVAVKPRTERLAMFDAMRVLAALAVIFTHVSQSGLAKKLSGSLQFGVAFFTVAAMILLARSIARRPSQKWLDYTRVRTQRVMGPLLVWTAIYVVFFYGIYRVFGRGVWVDEYHFDTTAVPKSLLGLLLGGAAIHLWYLPFILIACIGAFPLLKIAHARPIVRYAGAVALAVLGWLCIKIQYNPTGYGYGTDTFLRLSLYTMPSLCWAIAMAMVYPKHVKSSHAIWIVPAGVALFIACAYASWQGMSSPLIRAGKGVAAGVISLAPWSPLIVQLLAKLGQLSFGVYLVHFLFVHVSREVVAKLVGPVGLTGVLAQTALVFVISYVCVFACSRTKWGKLLFP